MGEGILPATGNAEMKYDLLLSGARVIDPSQGIDAVREVAVRDGLVAAVSEGIDPAQARDRIDDEPQPRVHHGNDLVRDTHICA